MSDEAEQTRPYRQSSNRRSEEYVVPSDLVQRVVGHLLGGLTTVQAAQEPCEHGLRYRGTGRACGYCLAVAEMAVDGVNDRAATRRSPCRCPKSECIAGDGEGGTYRCVQCGEVSAPWD